VERLMRRWGLNDAGTGAGDDTVEREGEAPLRLRLPQPGLRLPQLLRRAPSRRVRRECLRDRLFEGHRGSGSQGLPNCRCLGTE